MSWAITVQDLVAIVGEAVHSQIIVTFRVWPTSATAPDPHYRDRDRVADSLRGIADLEAGASDIRLPGSVWTAEEEPAADEGLTDVRLRLVTALGDEVAACACGISAAACVPLSGERFRCCLCPFLTLESQKALRQHLDRDHAASTYFCAAGRKMLSVVYAIFDRDRVSGAEQGRYLARARRRS